MWRRVVPLGVLSLASVAVFGAALFLDQALFFRDILHYYWPTRAAAAAAWSAGELPLWNPGPSSGVPLLADLHAAVLYPFNALYQVLSFPRAYAWLTFLHHVAGGLGVFTLVRRFSANRWAAIAGGMSFMLSGYLVSLHLAGPLMSGGAYVPWVLVVLTSQAPAWRRIAGVAALCALQAFSGDPQSVLFSGLVALAAWAWLQPTRREVGVMAGGFALAGLVSAVQLLPAWQLLKASSRGVQGLETPKYWALHPLRLLELFLPMPYGDYLETPRYWINFVIQGPVMVPFSLSIYLGASALVLATLGLRRSRWAGLGLTLVGMGLLLALAPYIGLSSLHAHVPPFRLFRYPEKYLFLTSLGWSFLVALGMERVMAPERLPRRRLLGLAAVWGVAALILVLGVVGREQALTAARALLQAMGHMRPAEGPLDALLASLTRGVVTVLALAGALVLLRRQPERGLPAVLVLAVLGFDLVSTSRRVVWTDDSTLFEERPELIQQMASHAPDGTFRFWRDTRSFMQTMAGASNRSQMTFLRAWELVTLKSNVANIWGLEEVTGYGAVKLWDHEELFLRVPSLRLAELFNGCFIVAAHPTSYPPEAQLTPIYENADLRLALLQVRNCTPRLHGVRRLLHADSRERAIRMLASAKFDPRTDAVVESGPETEFSGDITLSDVQVGRQSASARALVPASGGMLVFATSFYPAWRARVDGVDVPLEVVNRASMGVRLPAGEHHVEFAYRDPWVRWGFAASCLGGLLLLLALWAGRTGARASAPAPQQEPALLET